MHGYIHGYPSISTATLAIYDTSRSANNNQCTIKKDTPESFSECTGVSNVVKVGRKTVPGGWLDRSRRNHVFQI